MPRASHIVAVAAATAAAASAVAPTTVVSSAPNMNAGVVYTVSNPGPSAPSSYPFYGEHFEILTPPLQHHYGEVFWRTIGPVPLPDDIVARYNGSAMAVTGWEVDVVRKLPNGTEESVPCFDSYNHHYSAWIYGAGVKYTEREDDGRLRPAVQLQFSAEEGVSEAAAARAAATTRGEVVPGVQAFNEHNGNEARQSYHGLPRNVVQPIQSPQRFVMNPMQINTNFQNAGDRGGPLPRESQAPPGALYSGCVVVKTPSAYAVKSVRCADAVVRSAAECVTSAAEVASVAVVANRTIGDPARPPGCFLTPVTASSVTSASGDAAKFDAVFNTAANSTATCVAANDTAISRVEGGAASLVSVRVVADTTTSGDRGGGAVNITLSGPADAWFAVGFDAVDMTDMPWTVVISAGASAADPPVVTERRLGDHAPGKLLPQTQVVLLANHVDVQANMRTVTLTRALAGADADRFTFDVPALASTSLDYICAVGATRAFDGNRHTQSASAAVSFVATARSRGHGGPAAGLDTCVCRGDTGTISEKGGPSVVFNPQCMDEPISDLLAQRNPTCYLNSYRGGLYCCKDGFVLLDQDQELPPEVDTVFYRWRFYFVDYNPAEHTPVVHVEQQFGHIEYDVPQAPAGTPPAEAVHTLTTRFTMADLFNLYSHAGCDPLTEPYCADVDKATKGVRLLMMGGHCHAPACLDISLYNNDTGELLCRIEPTRGAGNTTMDEAGYLWLPPCEWGSPEEGMLPPPIVQLSTNFTSIKHVNSTVGHTGVMAIWQGRAAYVE